MLNSTIYRLKTVRNHNATPVSFYLKVLCISKLKQEFQLYKHFNKLFIGGCRPRQLKQKNRKEIKLLYCFRYHYRQAIIL
jgi:hypothetical protein